MDTCGEDTGLPGTLRPPEAQRHSFETQSATLRHGTSPDHSPAVWPTTPAESPTFDCGNRPAPGLHPGPASHTPLIPFCTTLRFRSSQPSGSSASPSCSGARCRLVGAAGGVRAGGIAQQEGGSVGWPSSGGRGVQRSGVPSVPAFAWAWATLVGMCYWSGNWVPGGSAGG